MNRNGYGLLARALLVLLAVSSTASADVPYASQDQERRAKAAAPPTGKALIYLFRGDMSGEADLPVYLNGRFAANTAPGSFVIWVAAPGRYVLSPGQNLNIGASVQAEAGRSYYVRQDVAAGGGSVIALTTLATGRYAVSSRRLIDLAGAAKQAPQTGKSATPPPARKTATASKRPAPASAQKAGREQWAVLARMGRFDIVDEGQTLAGVATAFDMAATGAFGVEAQYRMPSGLVLGAEAMLYQGDMKAVSSANTGTMDVTNLLANVYQYFRVSESFYPYVGVGVGTTLVSFSGNVVTGDTSGLATQVMLGVEWRIDDFGLFVDWRRITAETEDDLGQKANASVRGFTAGVNYRF